MATNATLTPRTGEMRWLLSRALLGVETIEIGGIARGFEHDVLNVHDQVVLNGGTLQVILMDGFTPANGDKFDILDFGSIAGSFDDLLLPEGRWDTSNLLVNGTLLRIPEPCTVSVLMVPVLLLAPRRRLA